MTLYIAATTSLEAERVLLTALEHAGFTKTPIVRSYYYRITIEIEEEILPLPLIKREIGNKTE